ncbi:uncharacterized protein LOC119370847 [Jatropha curcas]|uniref:uncharacterized protein LOC119370847 n=1 Tax=Jatropha curcas TaxID=180498 RepID=UPI0018958594|nr:uncharacterized protein LOC119370847 [Jatropha curcas]
MASSLPFSCSFKLPCFCRLKELKYLQVRSQSFSDDGTSANIVDSNMGTLRERIAQVRVKDRLEKCCSLESLQNGWNYESGYNNKHKRYSLLCEGFEIVSFAGTALGFVFLSGSLCLCLVSLLLHLYY